MKSATWLCCVSASAANGYSHAVSPGQKNASAGIPAFSAASSFGTEIFTAKTVLPRSSRVCTFFGLNSASPAIEVTVPPNVRPGNASTATATGAPTSTAAMRGSGT